MKRVSCFLISLLIIVQISPAFAVGSSEVNEYENITHQVATHYKQNIEIIYIDENITISPEEYRQLLISVSEAFVTTSDKENNTMLNTVYEGYPIASDRSPTYSATLRRPVLDEYELTVDVKYHSQLTQNDDGEYQTQYYFDSFDEDSLGINTLPTAGPYMFVTSSIKGNIGASNQVFTVKYSGDAYVYSGGIVAHYKALSKTEVFRSNEEFG